MPRNEATSSEVIVSFFFNARGDDLEKSVDGMYRSLLFQLFKSLPDLQEVFDKLPSRVALGYSGRSMGSSPPLCRNSGDAV